MESAGFFVREGKTWRPRRFHLHCQR